MNSVLEWDKPKWRRTCEWYATTTQQQKNCNERKKKKDNIAMGAKPFESAMKCGRPLDEFFHKSINRQRKH